ncbi:importin-4 [Notothenia coriiceps]|uniref:Importin-4 n=1 Tax=Notothenia coriiceps TaxID=8208 RepID=A0A6I9NXR3_9TELE|nr:PREDICTED: importin-4 [Notothenia coriiceps]
MTEELELILSQLTQPDNAVIQQATVQLKQAFKDPAIIPALCAVMSGSQNPQIRQSAAVMLRLRVKKHWKKINPNDRESLKTVVLQAFMQETEHTVQHSLSQLCAMMVKHETPDRWPDLLQLLNQATKSSNPHDRQVGLLLLNKVMESNPEPFKPHYCQLLQLFTVVLQDLQNPTALYYCILTLTAITAYTGTEEMNLMRSIIPHLIVALKHLIKADQSQASEAMEVFNELMESEVSIIVPHIADIVRLCLEVGSDTTLNDSVRVKALSCIAFLIKLKSKTVLKQKLLTPILQAIFPILIAAPPPGEQDPEDQEDDSGDGTDNDNPKHCSAQIIDTMALHMPPEKLFQQLMPMTQTCLASENPYERKGGLMCLAVLAEGCADHIRTKMLSSVLQTVCQSLSDSNQVVRSASLFALGQFSEHLQPEVSKYCSELMPLLLGYLSSLNQAKVGHVTKAFYALENFMENLGADIEPYLPTLMETMLSALNISNNSPVKRRSWRPGKEGDEETWESKGADSRTSRFSVENAYIDEKEDACDALGEIAFSTGAAFQPFLESSFQQVYEMRDFPHEDVRRAAFGAMGQFCRAQHLVWKEIPTEANHQALLKLLDVVLPCFVESVRTEHERQVVMGILETMNNVMKSCKEEAFKNPARLKEISHVIRDVLKKKTVCQDGGGDEADDEEQQAEYDAMLQEFAGEGIPLVASSVPADKFSPFLNDLLPLLMNKTKSSCTVADRSFSVGTIGEILQALVTAPGGAGVAGRLSNRLLPVLVAGVRDSDAEVRNNSVFGLGCLAQAAGPICVTDYPMMLSVFSSMLTKESDLRVIDNLCGALCRMIHSNVDAVPLEQVVPALVGRLPLKEDMDENKTVYSCLAMLYTHSPALVLGLMKPIVAASSQVLGNNKVDQETQSTLALLMRDFAQQHSAAFQAAVSSLPGEQQAALSAALS